MLEPASYNAIASRDADEVPKKRRRLYFALALVIAGGGGAALVVRALKDNVLYFYSPTDVQREARAARRRVPHRRTGAEGQRHARTGRGRPLRRHGRQEPRCRWTIPACCRLCSAKGRAWSRSARWPPAGTFRASEVLAKHDERYMPPEVVDALKRSGRWKEGGT